MDILLFNFITLPMNAFLWIKICSINASKFEYLWNLGVYEVWIFNIDIHCQIFALFMVWKVCEILLSLMVNAILFLFFSRYRIQIIQKKLQLSENIYINTIHYTKDTLILDPRPNYSLNRLFMNPYFRYEGFSISCPIFGLRWTLLQ